MQIDARLEELRKERQQTSIRAGQLQEEFNKTVVQVHQLDGAIAALEDVLAEMKNVDSRTAAVD